MLPAQLTLLRQVPHSDTPPEPINIHEVIMNYYEFLREHPNVIVRLLAQALQDMEEMGGPEGDEYREALRALRCEVEIRLENSLVLKLENKHKEDV